MTELIRAVNTLTWPAALVLIVLSLCLTTVIALFLLGLCGFTYECREDKRRDPP